MKKFYMFILLGCILLSLSACGKNNDTDNKSDTKSDILFNEEDLESDAKSVASSLVSGDYASVTAKFDETMTKAVPLKTLEDGWLQTINGVGDYIDCYSVNGSEDSGYYVVIVIEKFESSGVQIRIVYDISGKIAGLQCSLTELEAHVMSGGITEQDITVCADDRYPLSGSLTLPEGVEKPPVVILVQGSGSSDKDESYNGNKSFFDIACGLAEQGVATLRYDKRYFNYPDAGIALGTNVTIRDEVLDDLYAAIKLMQEDDRVDNKRIYVLGHSLGAMLTPAIAAENPSLAGIISMAGSLRPLWEISYDQNQEAISTLDVSTLSEDDKATLDMQIQQIENDITTLRGDFSNVSDDTILMGIPAGYWKSLKELNGMNYIKDITMPILILQGGADFQVYPDKDYPLWQETLSGRDNVVFHLYDNLNHLMMPTQGKRDISEYAVAGKVDQQVISDIATFVNETSNTAK